MEMVIYNRYRVKHTVTITTIPPMQLQGQGSPTNIMINIVRYRTNGGVPKTIKHFYDSSLTVGEFNRKITNIIELDDEIYTMVSEHTNGA